MEYGLNPLTGMDYPDPDVIRVGGTFYMISTTMHFFPGGVILRSFDLIHWEICTYLYDALEHTPGETLEGEQTVYGHGMWAACLRFHQGKYYAVFIAHEWGSTFLFTADRIEGPWKKQYIRGIYHDPSLLFDDDGRTYIVYGNREIRLTELEKDLSGPRLGGLDRVIVRDAPGGFLGYEGSHIYKINGKYVLFLIHSARQEWYRIQACFTADELQGVWEGGDVLKDDLDRLRSGPAQGGVVDTPDGWWYAVLFQDRGAVGRVPVLVPIAWSESGYPVFGRVTREVSNVSTRPGTLYEPLYGSDDFRSAGLKKVWQFNHEPRKGYWQTGDGYYRITTDKISRTLEFARNTLTQRTVLPGCSACVTAEAGQIRDGDVAGLCLLIGSYALIGVTRENGRYFLVMKARDFGAAEETEHARIPLPGPQVRLKASVAFEGMEGVAKLFCRTEHGWEQLGPEHRMRFALDHFSGCRFGLFLYSPREAGGTASFRDFEYTKTASDGMV